jgi:hypothetical protein
MQAEVRQWQGPSGARISGPQPASGRSRQSPTMLEMRCLDKLVDELAGRNAMDKILRA